MAQRVLDTYFQPAGRPDGRPYRPVPKLTLRQTPRQQELAVVANFAEVWLAKDGCDGAVWPRRGWRASMSRCTEPSIRTA